MKLATYSRYKPSGIDWLEKIPEHWTTNRIKSLGEIRYGLGQPPREKEDGLPIIRATNISKGKISKKDLLFVDPNDLPYERKPILKKNEIIIVRSGAYTGDSAIITNEYEGSVSGYDMVYTPKKIISEFIAYSFLSNYVLKDQLILSSLRAAQPHLNKDELGKSMISIPPLPEQTAIAAYLDRKTAAIDKKVELLEQKIAYYQQLRKSLINQTVCRSLDRNVKLKDSGIKWIGMIPEHWVAKRMKDIGFLFSGLSGKSGEDFNQDKNNNNCDYIPFTNIFNNNTINPEIMGKVVVSALEKQNKVKRNDLFFLMSSEDYDGLGKSSLLTLDLKNTYLNSFCKGFRITQKEVYPAFLNYQLQSNTFKRILQVEGKGFTRINLKSEKISDFKVFIPNTIKEQEAITYYLDNKTQKIDSIIINIKTQIATLKELRKTLINDVVTGKIRVVD